MKSYLPLLPLFSLIALPVSVAAGGYCYQRSYAYPVYYAAPPAYVAPTAPAVSFKKTVVVKDWKTAYVDMIGRRDALVAQYKRTELDYQAFSAAMNKLGDYSMNYGGYPGTAYNAGSGYGNRALVAQGATNYGYSVQSVREMYGETNLNTLYQQSARLTQGAQQLAGQANSEFAGLVGAAGSDAARVAEIRARAQAAAIALQATAPQPRVVERTTISGGGNAGSGGTYAPSTMPPADAPAVGADVTAARAEFLKNIGVPLCGACHAGDNAKAGFVIANYPLMNAAQRKLVLKAILSDDPVKRMPLGADGKPGKRLTAEQKVAFVTLE